MRRTLHFPDRGLPFNGRVPILMVLVMLLILSVPYGAVASSPGDQALVPSVRDAVLARTEGVSSAYSFNVVLDPGAQTISGTGQVKYVNQTGVMQAAIPFRLYPNADYYGNGALDIVRVRVGGMRVHPTFSSEATVMTVPLPAPVMPGETVDLAYRFTVSVPINSAGSFGIFSFDAERGTWILADWYPVIAGWEPGRGWVLDPPTPAGDPTFSDVGTYDVTLSLPANLTVVATGSESAGVSESDMTVWRIVTGPVREFAMVIDDDFITASQQAGETRLNVYSNGDGLAAAGARAALDAAAAALAEYSALFGTYPYAELDLVETELGGALGVSWAGLVFLNGDQFLSSAFFVDEQPERLRFTAAHEVGHQWWGALIGVNSNDHSFLLEGLTNYLAVVAIERIDGVEAATDQLQVQAVQPYLRALAEGGDGIADAPVDAPPVGGPSRGTLIYGKAALGFLAIRQQIGDDAFFTALRAWADEFGFAIAGPEDLLAAFEAASGQELDGLWTFWFQSAVTTEADVLALLDV